MCKFYLSLLLKRSSLTKSSRKKVWNAKEYKATCHFLIATFFNLIIPYVSLIMIYFSRSQSCLGSPYVRAKRAVLRL